MQDSGTGLDTLGDQCVTTDVLIVTEKHMSEDLKVEVSEDINSQRCCKSYTENNNKNCFVP